LLKNWDKTHQKVPTLAESVGNNTLYSELEKLRFAGAVNKHLDVDSVAQLVQTNTKARIWRRRFEQGMQPRHWRWLRS